MAISQNATLTTPTNDNQYPDAQASPPPVRPFAPRPAMENFINTYYRDLSGLDVLGPEEEFEAARKLEQQEISLWTHALSYPPMLEMLAATASRKLREPVSFNSLKKQAQELRKRTTVARRRKYLEACEAAACQAHAVDQDRKALAEVVQQVQSTSRGEQVWFSGARVSVKPRSKAFRDYHTRVRSLQAGAQRMRNEFIKANLRLVVSIARRFHHGTLPLNDMIQEGNLGLIKAVERYDYRKGYRFSTYASWWIRHSISRAVADKGRAVRLPVHLLEAHYRVTRATKELSVKLGRQPSNEEISKVARLPEEKVLKVQQQSVNDALSLDRAVSGDDDRKFIEMLYDPDAAGPADRLAMETMTDQVRQVLQHLKPMEADILNRRFGLEGEEEQTLRAIGEGYELSRERIRQIQEHALTKIRRALECRRAV